LHFWGVVGLSKLGVTLVGGLPVFAELRNRVGGGLLVLFAWDQAGFFEWLPLRSTVSMVCVHQRRPDSAKLVARGD
jgi:hypothetical protein